jgi:hypothetical protein
MFSLADSGGERPRFLVLQDRFQYTCGFLSVVSALGIGCLGGSALRRLMMRLRHLEDAFLRSSLSPVYDNLFLLKVASWNFSLVILKSSLAYYIADGSTDLLWIVYLDIVWAALGTHVFQFISIVHYLTRKLSILHSRATESHKLPNLVTLTRLHQLTIAAFGTLNQAYSFLLLTYVTFIFLISVNEDYYLLHAIISFEAGKESFLNIAVSTLYNLHNNYQIWFLLFFCEAAAQKVLKNFLFLKVF